MIDMAVFEELKEASGAEFLNELIDTFVADAPNMVAEMKSALAVGDADSFRRAAHSLKSNAATFGVNELTALAKDLETLGREKKLEDATAKLGSLEAGVASACEVLLGLKS